MELKGITLSERNQTQMPLIIWLYLYEMSRRGKSTETESNKRLQGNGEWELVLTAQYCKYIKNVFLKNG